jgi:hypothetical protein
MVDEFVLYDHVQFTRRDWRNRNLLKTPAGPMWLTIPVEMKGQYLRRICDTRVSDPLWNRRHWKIITQNYSRARFFGEYRQAFEDLYLNETEPMLSTINYHFLLAVCTMLGIATKISWSLDYHVVYADHQDVPDGKTRRLIDVCRQAGATEYISGPAAIDYLNPRLFEQAGITLTYMDYSAYPEYEQLYPPFDHKVSILDLIFNTGKEAPRYMKSFAECSPRPSGVVAGEVSVQRVP